MEVESPQAGQGSERAGFYGADLVVEHVQVDQTSEILKLLEPQ